MSNIKLIITLAFCLVCSINTFANDGKDELILQYSTEYGVHYTHTMAPKETIYSISKNAGVTVDQIYKANRITKSDIISIGQQIIVPVSSESISSTRNADTSLKVMYQVKKKDNLFQIAKRYFNQEVNAVVSRNNLPNMTLSPGQLLHIGWIKTNSMTYSQTAVAQTATKPNTIPQTTKVVTTSTVTNQRNSSTQPQAVDNGSYRVVQHTKLSSPTEKVAIPESQQINTSPNQTTSEVVSEVVYHTSTPPSSSTTPTTVNRVIVNQSPSAVANPIPVENTVSSTTTKAPTTTGTTATEVNNTGTTTTITRSETASPELSFLTDPNLLSDKGMAIWDRDDNEPLNLYVLHQSAKVNSYMKVINPMIGRVVIAKVIGRLPDNVYGGDVKMVVSTAVAKSLGIMDSRFLTEMKFIK